MKSLTDLKEEIAPLVEKHLLQLKKRYPHNGNNIKDKFENIKDILNQPFDDDANSCEKYYSQIKPQIDSLEFLNINVPRNQYVETLKVFKQHLENVEILIAEKKSAVELPQVELKNEHRENEITTQQQAQIKNTIEPKPSSQVPNANVSANVSQDQNTLIIQNNILIATLLRKYAEQLRKDDWVPTLFSKFSVKAYKANKLSSLANEILELNHAENLVADAYKIILENALQDKELIRGRFQHRTLNLLKNILEGNTNNYIDEPISERQNAPRCF